MRFVHGNRFDLDGQEDLGSRQGRRGHAQEQGGNQGRAGHGEDGSEKTDGHRILQSG